MCLVGQSQIGIQLGFFVNKLQALLKNFQVVAKVLDHEGHIPILWHQPGVQELDEGELGRHSPAKEVAEDDIVAEGDDVGEDPENAFVLPVVEVHCGDVLSDRLLRLEKLLCMLVKQGGVIPSNNVELIRFIVIHKFTIHDDSGVLGVHDSFHTIHAGVICNPCELIDNFIE